MLPEPVRAQLLEAARPTVRGRVCRLVGMHLEVEGVEAGIGDAIVVDLGGGQLLPAEVVGLEGQRLICMPHREMVGVRFGNPAWSLRRPPLFPVGPSLLGRVLDPEGRPLDDLGPIEPEMLVPVESRAPLPLERTRISEQLQLGVRVLDTLVPCGVGQRLGIFAGAGVGKSTLLSMIVRGAAVDATVLALVGERGREVREFLEEDLGTEGLRKATVVVATSDTPPLVRVRAALAATRVAEWYRDQGMRVLLVMDSLTRLGLAQREIGLSAGEPPSVRGYPPSVFSLMARLLERAGTASVGSITGIYSVLVEGDDLADPIADAARSVLDGHIVLSRTQAQRGLYPAVSVLESLSRLESAIVPDVRRTLAAEARRLFAELDQVQDLVDLGAYVHGSNPVVDRALALVPRLRELFGQRPDDLADAEESWAGLARVLGGER